MRNAVIRFFAGEDETISLCLKLLCRLDEALDEYEIRPAKTQLSMYSGCMFGCLSHPRSQKQGKVLVTFGLPAKVVSGRVQHAVEAAPGRWTHHVPISTESEIDDELIGWLAAAQAFAKAKKKR